MNFKDYIAKDLTESTDMSKKSLEGMGKIINEHLVHLHEGDEKVFDNKKIKKVSDKISMSVNNLIKELLSGKHNI
jgi:hypothetical protein